MTRAPRNIAVVPNQANHFVVRGNNRRRLFSYPRDYHMYVRYLRDALHSTRCLLHAACFMANHIHLLVTPPTIDAASKLMQKTNQRYAQIRNHVRNGSGKLFEERFWSGPVVGPRAVKTCTLYIDANPYRSHLHSHARYRWSTNSLHSGCSGDRALDSLIVFTPWYLSLGPTPDARATAYRAAFVEYLTTDPDEDEHHWNPKDRPTVRFERPDRTTAI